MPNITIYLNDNEYLDFAKLSLVAQRDARRKAKNLIVKETNKNEQRNNR